MVLKETAPPLLPYMQHPFKPRERERERDENNISTNREIHLLKRTQIQHHTVTPLPHFLMEPMEGIEQQTKHCGRRDEIDINSDQG